MSTPSPAKSLPLRAPAQRQCADAVLMIRPARFGYNPETAQSNAFQHAERPANAAACAEAEFDALAAALVGEGVRVCVVADCAEPAKPDAVFPNNWVSFHADGTVVLYPMQALSRRAERREDVLQAVSAQLGFRATRVLDLTAHEREGRFLEGTGSLVLDRPARVAYACHSPRTDAAVLEEWAQALGYDTVLFEAADRDGVPFYHTNVLMSLGERFALIGAAAIAEADRARVLERLRAGGRELIEVGYGALEHFAGNVLELATEDEALGDCRIVVMSRAARDSLEPDTFARLAACTDDVLVAPLPTIERLGGGSARCMLAEVFQP
ncbi:MAG: citrulline utilization hydrolase CtlX [Steroidobacteraceae bacterium]